jgi:hypothetical protein
MKELCGLRSAWEKIPNVLCSYRSIETVVIHKSIGNESQDLACEAIQVLYIASDTLQYNRGASSASNAGQYQGLLARFVHLSWSFWWLYEILIRKGDVEVAL